ncbi:MAG: hypothetical protein RBR13_01040 [Tenuifilaceae bacterium]|nr:hypothetical protein [Tenuifilaceae bacterium]
MGNKKFRNRYRIQTARANWHEYNGGLYFVTVCTAAMKHYFGKIENGKMEYSVVGQYLDNSIEQTHTHYNDAEIPLFVVMPNHFHAIIAVSPAVQTSHGASQTQTNTAPCKDVACRVSIDDMKKIADQCGRLSYIVGGIKSATTKFARKHDIEFAWQARFHDRIIRNQNEYNRIAQYIENNIAKWESDKK